ncbi:DUF488 family protein [Dietzia timorensis]|uniref:DUF488 domain-containing protein n=1 Tax=Dietzia timorensis TaxID=499555 RepID=A0A173LJ47_9ACTN|nr:DUF488 domain-containing protein [Dietzia timorensis]ANI91923.1 Hypothetical protein BJL86_1133 [Dietzia timorensis]
MRFFTIGHSTRTIDEFLALLREAGVDVVVDVRRLPGSNRYPQFNADALSSSLHAAGADYSRIEELTGRRGRDRSMPSDVNGFWRNRSFHNYADWAMTSEFRTGLDRLRALGEDAVPAVMCSEAVWWRCHRRLIADNLLAAGDDVRHIMRPGVIEHAELTRGAVVDPETRQVTYPATDGGP